VSDASDQAVLRPAYSVPESARLRVEGLPLPRPIGEARAACIGRRGD
jgi:hypothetical protein